MEFNKRDKELLERAKNTLLANVHKPDAGYLWSPYRCVDPGINHFNGIWNWDSAFHALGLSKIDPILAKESILGFLKFQHKNGFLPDCILTNGRIVDWLSKPPVFAWAAEEVYKVCKDKEFLKEVYPKLRLNLIWWYENRCYNGLFFYDAENKESDDYIQSVKYESGWDNAVRWDKGITNFWAVDLNCFVIMFLRSMSYIAKELEIFEEADEWNEKEMVLTNLINEKLWDNENNFYGDTEKFTEKVSEVLSPANFMPLYINIASKERAEFMEKIAAEKFEFKMPTVSFDNVEYSNDYWRGPTWLNAAYFAAKGLKNYGFETADKIKENILNMCFEEKSGIYENYDSKTGKGLCCDHFSWSCVFIREFILNW